MHLFLVHHGDAVGPDIDARRPLSPHGRAAVDRVAQAAAGRGARPSRVWHSGKLRAKQTAEAYWRACNPLAEFSATKDLQPDDPPRWMRDRLRAEASDPKDVMIVGHFPHLPRLLAMLRGEPEGAYGEFPPHGIVALVSDDEGDSWKEVWRIDG